jgi:hypothetical protein
MYRGVHSGAVYTYGGNVGKVQVKRMKGSFKNPLIKRLEKKVVTIKVYERIRCESQIIRLCLNCTFSFERLCSL